MQEISSSMIRAARSLLGWRQKDLANITSLSLITVQRIESDKYKPNKSTSKLIVTAFHAHGITFLCDSCSISVTLKLPKSAI